MNIIELENLRYRWQKNQALTVDIAKLTVKKGEKLFIQGASGSGKSTFLSLLTGINKPLAGGFLKVAGQDLSKLNAIERDTFRANKIGYIFQQFNLIPYLSVIENVLLPCQFSIERRAAVGNNAQLKAAQLLSKLGLDEQQLNTSVLELSIGQQQRVAAARALIGSPALIVADEPSSALDKESCHLFLKLLMQECTKAQSTLLFVSHDETLKPFFDTHININTLARVDRA
jgi:putative ABC transport system ATP-binding protein